MKTFEEEHKTYQKINTLYKRGEKNRIILGNFSLPEFEYLFDNKWLAFEKIDGTNMSWYWDGHELQIHGKSVSASIPSSLMEKMKSVLPIELLKEKFPPKFDDEGNEKPFMMRIYGEGYGNKIQKYGERYISDDVDIKVFDIMINGYWLNWEDVKDICKELNLEHVPEFGIMTLREAEKIVKNGFKSTVSEDKDYNAEGLVLRPLYPLYNKKGERLIVKIKTKDYNKLKK